ncbi:hypothetical protein G7Y79_00012g032780 [Physcia stellaris]|nr:hypothetical protein G7Y79_00012g032780 [Physcia stellaris]
MAPQTTSSLPCLAAPKPSTSPYSAMVDPVSRRQHPRLVSPQRRPTGSLLPQPRFPPPPRPSPNSRPLLAPSHPRRRQSQHPPHRSPMGLRPRQRSLFLRPRRPTLPEKESRREKDLVARFRVLGLSSEETSLALAEENRIRHLEDVRALELGFDPATRIFCDRRREQRSIEWWWLVPNGVAMDRKPRSQLWGGAAVMGVLDPESPPAPPRQNKTLRKAAVGTLRKGPPQRSRTPATKPRTSNTRPRAQTAATAALMDRIRSGARCTIPMTRR